MNNQLDGLVETAKSLASKVDDPKVSDSQFRQLVRDEIAKLPGWLKIIPKGIISKLLDPGKGM